MQYIKKLFIKDISIANIKEYVVQSDAQDPFCTGKKNWVYQNKYYAFEKYDNWIRDVINGKHLRMHMDCDRLYIEHLTNGKIYGIREDGLLYCILVKNIDYNELLSNNIFDQRTVVRVENLSINIDLPLRSLWHDFYLNCAKRFEMDKRIEIINDNF